LQIIKRHTADTVTVKLHAVAQESLQEVAVTASKPFVQHAQGKTIVNVDAAVTNAGTTVLEVLEKSPGVMVIKMEGLAYREKQVF
jgi:iron complex outermembrane receptor protein